MYRKSVRGESEKEEEEEKERGRENSIWRTGPVGIFRCMRSRCFIKYNFIAYTGRTRSPVHNVRRYVTHAIVLTFKRDPNIRHRGTIDNRLRLH